MSHVWICKGPLLKFRPCQCVAVCCRVLRCVAVCYKRSIAEASHMWVWCSVQQCVVVCSGLLQCVAVCNKRSIAEASPMFVIFFCLAKHLFFSMVQHLFFSMAQHLFFSMAQHLFFSMAQHLFFSIEVHFGGNICMHRNWYHTQITHWSGKTSLLFVNAITQGAIYARPTREMTICVRVICVWCPVCVRVICVWYPVSVHTYIPAKMWSRNLCVKPNLRVCSLCGLSVCDAQFVRVCSRQNVKP